MTRKKVASKNRIAALHLTLSYCHSPAPHSTSAKVLGSSTLFTISLYDIRRVGGVVKTL